MHELDDITAHILLAGRPGALTEILGRPLVCHLLDRLAVCGVRRAVLYDGSGTTTPEADTAGSLPAGDYRDMTIFHARAGTPPNDGAALRQAFARHPAPLALVLSGDRLSDADLELFARWFAERSAPGEAGALLLAHAADAARRGRVAVDCAGGGTGFGEPGRGAPGFYSAGACLLRPESLDGLAPGCDASLEADVLPALAAAGRLCALETRARVLDLGAPQPSAETARFLLEPGPAAHFGRAAVFLDRDGTVIKDAHYLHNPAEVELLPGAAEGLRRLRAAGLRLVLVTNQSGVGRGYFPRGDVERVHGRLIELLEAEGARLDAIYTCPHAPEDDCRCRKPRPGLIERACREIGLDPAQSFVIGDKPCDVDLGLAAGAASVLVTTGYGAQHEAELRTRGGVLVARDLTEAAAAIEKQRG